MTRLTQLTEITRAAVISRDEGYRYLLTRQWSAVETPGYKTGDVVWIMLNPSTADGTEDDPTITRCIAFTRTWGYASMSVVNLFALRATDPEGLKCADPVGEKNDQAIETVLYAAATQLIIAAWGTRGGYRYRDAAVLLIASRAQRTVHALALTKDGKPKHPLYVKGDVTPVVYR